MKGKFFRIVTVACTIILVFLIVTGCVDFGKVWATITGIRWSCRRFVVALKKEVTRPTGHADCMPSTFCLKINYIMLLFDYKNIKKLKKTYKTLHK